MWECTTDSSFIAFSLAPPQAASPAMQLLLINVFDCLAISWFLYLLVVFRDHRRRRGLPYPPGPPSRPIIGNLLDFPKDMPWSAYTEMFKSYGMRTIPPLGTCSPQLKFTFQRRRYLFSRFFSGRRRVVFAIRHQGSPRETRGNLLRKAFPANRGNVHSVVFCFPISRHVDDPPLSSLGRTWIGHCS